MTSRISMAIHVLRGKPLMYKITMDGEKFTGKGMWLIQNNYVGKKAKRFIMTTLRNSMAKKRLESTEQHGNSNSTS